MWRGDKPIVHIRFDDNDLSFIFESEALIGPFVREFGIKVNTDGLMKELHDAEGKVESIRQIVNKAKDDLGDVMEG